jgi:intracellular septation protein A
MLKRVFKYIEFIPAILFFASGILFIIGKNIIAGILMLLAGIIWLISRIYLRKTHVKKENS